MKRLTKLAFSICLTASFLSLAGCGSKNTTSASDSNEKQLNLYCWSEYVPQEVIEAFSSETGIKVSVQNYASMEEMVQKLLSGGGAYDLIQPAESTIEVLAKANQLLPLDFNNLPNFKNIAPEFKNLPHDPEQKYTVPWMSGMVGIVVNTEKVKEPIARFSDLFQPKFKGRIVVPEDARELVSMTMSNLGMAPNEVTPQSLQKVRPVLGDWMKLVKSFDSDSPKTAFLNGEVDLGVVWSGEAALLYAQNKKFKWILPAEGTHRFVDSLAIPRTAKHKANAEAFMDFVLRPRISKIISDKFPYTNPNIEARKLLSPDQINNPASYPSADESRRLLPFADIGEMATEMESLITDLRAK